MKVRTYGFIWEPKSSKGIDDFMEYIRADFPSAMAQLGTPGIDQSDFKRLLAVSKIEEIWAGVFLTIKNTKRFITSQATIEGLKITSKSLEDNSQPVDVNLFVVNPSTGKGLYQHYHSSPNINTFGGYCDNAYNKCCGDTDRDAKLRQILYLTPADLASRIESLKSVNNVEYEFLDVRRSNQEMVAAFNHAERVSYQVFYNYHKAGAGVISQLAEYVKQNLALFRRFNGSGRDSDNNKVRFHMDQLSVFNEIEFDDFEIDFELKQKDVEAALRGSHTLQRLLRLTKQKEVDAFFSNPD